MKGRITYRQKKASGNCDFRNMELGLTVIYTGKNNYVVNSTNAIPGFRETKPKMKIYQGWDISH